MKIDSKLGVCVCVCAFWWYCWFGSMAMLPRNHLKYGGNGDSGFFDSLKLSKVQNVVVLDSHSKILDLAKINSPHHWNLQFNQFADNLFIYLRIFFFLAGCLNSQSYHSFNPLNLVMCVCVYWLWRPVLVQFVSTHSVSVCAKSIQNFKFFSGK